MIHPVIFYRNFKRIRRLFKSFQLSCHDLVLDIGSGQNPNPRSNVLCDRFLFDHTERNKVPAVIDRPMVVGDATNLPFKDNVFDFVICSHLLEHVNEPEKIISEIQRVGKRGYIETPSSVWEKIHSFPFHRWYVHKNNGTLIFRAKERLIHDPELKNWVKEVLSKKSNGLDFENRIYDLGTLVQYHWEDEINFKVDRGRGLNSDFEQSQEYHEHELKEQVLQEPRSFGTKIIDQWGVHLRKKSSHRLIHFENLIALCACPTCKGNIEINDNDLHCSRCKKVYKIRVIGNIQVPLLIP